jgi:hypothetical protein
MFGTLLNIPEKEGSYCSQYNDHRNNSENQTEQLYHEQVFKALALVEAKFATTAIKDQNRIPQAVNMSEHFVATDLDEVTRTSHGNPQRRGWSGRTKLGEEGSG